MKNSLVILASVALCVHANSATITLSPGFGTGVGAETSDGSELAGTTFYIAVGSFSSIPSFSMNNIKSTIESDFAIFSTVENSSRANGLISGEFSRSVQVGDSYGGEVIYVIVGNGTTFENSSQVGVFSVDPPTLTDPYTFPSNIDSDNSASATVQLRSVSQINTIENGGTVNELTGNFVLVPEPSLAGLGALAGLGLLVRRRR